MRQFGLLRALSIGKSVVRNHRERLIERLLKFVGFHKVVGDEARAGRVLDVLGARHHFGHVTRNFAPRAEQIDLEDEGVP